MTSRRTSGAASVMKSVDGVLNKEWYFWTNYGGSYMGHGIGINPVLTKSVGEQSKFRIVHVNSGPNPNIAKVAIERTKENGEKSYISCRRKCFITNSCLAEYRQTIGEFETFTMSYCAVDNSFIFQAHNDYFLHFNEAFYTAAFKPCSDREDGFPLKGRWDLLGTGETNRIGKKSAVKKIPRQVVLLPFKAVGSLFI